MNYLEAYCSKMGITRELAAEIIVSPAFTLIKDWAAKSKQVGQAEILTTYDTNQVNTLRGELRIIAAVEALLRDTKEFAEGRTSEPLNPLDDPSLLSTDYDASKPWITIK